MASDDTTEAMAILTKYSENAEVAEVFREKLNAFIVDQSHDEKFNEFIKLKNFIWIMIEKYWHKICDFSTWLI